MSRASVRPRKRRSSPPSSANAVSVFPATDASEVSFVSRVKQTWEKLSNWALLASWSNYSTKDRIIGLTLHCFILSAMVLGVVFAKASWFCIKFFCFVLINYAVFRGDIVPIQEDSNEPITTEQIQEATIFDSSGLKIILLQNRSKRADTPLPTMTPLHSYDSGSDSSQDIFSISTHH